MTTKEKTEKYVEAVGRRKTSVARVRITPASKTVLKINDRDLASYFPVEELRKIAEEALGRALPAQAGKAGAFSVSAHIKGGGIHSQAEALRLGLARALVKYDLESKTKLKSSGLLKRDPRAKERRKFGLKKARKAPQWSKR